MRGNLVFIERRTHSHVVERMGPYIAGSDDAKDAMLRQVHIAQLHNKSRSGGSGGMGLQLVYEIKEE